MQGIQVVLFEHTAWDLALAMQSLAYIDPDLAVLLSRIYNTQEAVTSLTSGVTQAMYLRPPTENGDAFLASVSVYYDDLVHFEPELIELYDDVLARLGRMLEKSS